MTTKHGHKVGPVTLSILATKWKLTDDEKRILNINIEKHAQERKDVFNAIELLNQGKQTLVMEYVNGKRTYPNQDGRHKGQPVIIRKHEAFDFMQMIDRAIYRLNNRLQSLYGEVVA